MTKSEFQDKHGAEWASMTAHPAFFAAMQVCSADKLQRISTITDEQIDTHGKAILADFRGHLSLENALIDLAVSTSEGSFDLPEETYEESSQQPSVPVTGEPTPGGAFHQFQAAQTQPGKPSTKKPCPQKPSKRPRKKQQ